MNTQRPGIITIKSCAKADGCPLKIFCLYTPCLKITKDAWLDLDFSKNE